MTRRRWFSWIGAAWRWLCGRHDWDEMFPDACAPLIPPSAMLVTPMDLSQKQKDDLQAAWLDAIAKGGAQRIMILRDEVEYCEIDGA